MHCPYCDCSDTGVIDTRPSTGGTSVRRRRVCKSCQKRFTTLERSEVNLPEIVDDRAQTTPFDAGRLRASLGRVMDNVQMNSQALDHVVEETRQQLLHMGPGQISLEAFVNLVALTLLKIDEVSYVRYVSFHRTFTSVSDYVKIVQEMPIAGHLDQSSLLELPSGGKRRVRLRGRASPSRPQGR